MSAFLDLFTLIINWMRECTIISFTLGGVEISLNALNVLVGGTAICIGIDVLHNIFEY